MKWRRQFTGQVSVDDALLRADKLLRGYGYHKTGQLAFTAYERSEPWSWSYALRPRSMHVTLNIWAEQMADHSRFTVEIENHNLTGNMPTLGRRLIEGELSDLENGIVNNQLPVVNRRYQNRVAGTTQAILMLCVTAIAFSMGKIAWHMLPVLGFVVYVAALVGGFYLLNFFKLPLLPFPEFPMHNPPGAKLVNEGKLDQVPVAPRKR